ncbi:histidine phosphatase family protein [Streptomyces sp. NPDC001922]|uniref:histidine phosphatase family protein n=1 Tax=Streptomyces sp. NPDC001922 TaxID=3364624 RepID=UPI003685DF76
MTHTTMPQPPGGHPDEAPRGRSGAALPHPNPLPIPAPAPAPDHAPGGRSPVPGGGSAVSRILLIRHAQSHASVNRLVAGERNCDGLTDLGREQSAHLAKRLASGAGPLHALLTSPVPRARETAEALGAHLGIGPPAVDTEVRELDFGRADGLSIQEYGRRYGGFDMTAEPERPFAPGGESWSQLLGRARGFMGRLVRQRPRQSVLVVCHSGFIVAASVGLLGIAPPEMFTDTSPAPTSINEFVHGDDGWRLARYDDRAHLTALEG